MTSTPARDRALEEDRRLAYVAVTRARDHLLLSGSPWAGTTRPRELSRFTIEIAQALGHDDPRIDPGENPLADAVRTLHWPMDALGSRRPRVTDAARAVEAAREHPAEADDELMPHGAAPPSIARRRLRDGGRRRLADGRGHR